MSAPVMTVRCACGWETTGSETDVVAATTEHGQRLHNMTPTRDQVMAMALSRDDPGAASRGDVGDERDVASERDRAG